MSYSLLIFHMQIFKSIDFKNNGPLKIDYLYFDTYNVQSAHYARSSSYPCFAHGRE